MKNSHRRVRSLTVFFCLASGVGLSALVRVAQMRAKSPVPGTAVIRSNPDPQKEQTVQSVTSGGLQVTTFNTASGRVIVNLPDDMMAGDTISGTVIAEPKGNNDEERAKNEAVLNGYVVELKPPQQSSRVRIPVSREHPLLISLGQGNGDQASRNTLEVMLLPENKPQDTARPNDVPIATARMHVWTSYGVPQMGSAADQAGRVQLPTIGQQGRPIEVPGSFDGNSSNTSVNVGGRDAHVLAESPRKAVFRAPANVTGPTEITVKEDNKETKGTFRNVGVNLTAPKTNLLKGESTEVHVEVNGLQGINGAVPLHLTKSGVVTMQGGDSQTIPIKPADVRSNGTFTTTRMITGQQTGAFSVTATVVVFNSCLQDDSNGNTLIFAETGDYIFCQGRAGLAGANPVSLTTMNLGDSTAIPQLCQFSYGPGSAFGGSGGITTTLSPPGAGEGTKETFGGGGGMTIIFSDFPYRMRNGCTITLQQNSAQFNLNATVNTCTNAGSASGFAYQQITGPSNTGSSSGKPSGKKINFTITDRDTRNNTCTCK